jgi:hypothetical protein
LCIRANDPKFSLNATREQLDAFSPVRILVVPGTAPQAKESEHDE